MAESSKKKTCFVISPIGEEGSDIRIRADQLYKYVFSPILEPLNYILSRADKLAQPGMITNQIIGKVVEVDLIVADLTGRNPNVYYELAIRHGLQKPFVHFIADDEEIPFDISGARAIKINVNDLDSVDRAKEEFRKQVTQIEKGEQPVDNPISVAFDLQKLKSSGTEENRLQLSAIRSIEAIERTLAKLNRRFDEMAGRSQLMERQLAEYANTRNFLLHTNRNRNALAKDDDDVPF